MKKISVLVLSLGLVYLVYEASLPIIPVFIGFLFGIIVASVSEVKSVGEIIEEGKRLEKIANGSGRFK